MSGDSEVVLITGGTGLVGNAVKYVVTEQSPEEYARYKFVFIGSKDGDLCNFDVAKKIFAKHRPSYVLHLAAMVGGLFKNESNNLAFFRSNMLMNDNVLKLCDEFKVSKCVSCLSTCIFPDKTSYPIDETMIHLGPPHDSNFGYSYAKRMIDVLNKGYAQKYDLELPQESEKPIFTAVIPTNVYGQHDNFNLTDSHVIPGLIHKTHIQVQEALRKGHNEAILTVFGSGKPLRQFIYSQDLARLMLWTLFNYREIDPIILSIDESEEITINQAAQLVAEAAMKLEPRVKIILQNDTNYSDGQLKKTASNKKLRKYLPNFTFTPIKEGIYSSVEWFWKNYETARR